MCEAISLSPERPDAALLGAVALLLRNRSVLPAGLSVAVDHGVVTLTGTVAWSYQRIAAERAAQSVPGVREVRNQVVVMSAVAQGDVELRIVDALRRRSDVEAHRITVLADGRIVTLSGTARSVAESNEAEHAASSTPGVSHVRNHLVISQSDERPNEAWPGGTCDVR